MLTFHEENSAGPGRAFRHDRKPSCSADFASFTDCWPVEVVERQVPTVITEDCVSGTTRLRISIASCWRSTWFIAFCCSTTLYLSEANRLPPEQVGKADPIARKQAEVLFEVLLASWVNSAQNLQPCSNRESVHHNLMGRDS